MRKSQIDEEQIESLISEVENMKERLEDFEKKYQKEDRTLLKSITKINESLTSFTARKDSIDTIIAKIKKLLPI